MAESVSSMPMNTAVDGKGYKKAGLRMEVR